MKKGGSKGCGPMDKGGGKKAPVAKKGRKPAAKPMMPMPGAGRGSFSKFN